MHFTARSSFFIIPAITLTAAIGLAQGTEVITGQVLLNDRPPGPLASEIQVDLVPEGRPGEPMKAMVTAEGEYRFMNLSPGSFIVTARAPGYRLAKTQVDVMGGNQTRGNTRLVLVPESGATAVVTSAQRISENELRAPKNAVKHLEKAERAFHENQLRAAEDALRKALAEYPEYARARVLQGQILRKLGKRREAALAYEAALKEDPTYGIAYQQLIEVYREAGEPASLRSAVDRWKRAEPAKPEPYLYSAAAHYDQGEYDQAIEQAHLAERYPHDHLPHLKLVLVNCYNKLRDPESAAVQMREFLERWPDDPLAPQVRTSLQEIQKFIHK